MSAPCGHDSTIRKLPIGEVFLYQTEEFKFADLQKNHFVRKIPDGSLVICLCADSRPRTVVLDGYARIGDVW
jgi:hypothetical protein